MLYILLLQHDAAPGPNTQHRSPTRRAPGPDTQSAGPDTQSAGARHTGCAGGIGCRRHASVKARWGPASRMRRTASSWELGPANGLEEGLFSFRDFPTKQDHRDGFIEPRKRWAGFLYAPLSNGSRYTVKGRASALRRVYERLWII